MTQVSALRSSGSAPASPSAGPQLLADITDLAKYYGERGLAGQELSEAELRFIVSLVRAQFVPAHEGMLARRGQVMVFGGAGAGKSSTVNIIAGVDVAEVNAQAGYTRHPSAIYLAEADADAASWPSKIGRLTRLDQPTPGDVDEDCYDTRPVQEPPVDPAFLSQHVVWDCPDLTTKDASHYEARVIEIAAVADVCVYVASDERYNDELPTNFLHAVTEAGKPTIVVLTKMFETDSAEFISLFRQQVVARLKQPGRILLIYPIPTPTQVKVHELWTSAVPHGANLRREITRTTSDLLGARRRAAARAAEYLSSRRGRLLDPLARDLGEWRLWVEQVRRSASAAVQRYEREYLERMGVEDFQEARDALLAALPIPGRYAYVWNILEYVRVPFRMLKSIASRYTDKKTTGTVDESFLLDRIREQLLDSLIVTVAHRRGRHGFWDALHRALVDPAQLRVEQVFQELRGKQTRELRTKRRDAYERMDVRLSQNPSLLWALRGGRLALDVVAVLLAVLLWYQFFGTSVWLIFVILLAIGLADDLARVLCQEYARRERDELLDQQRENIRELIRASYIDELVNLPKDLGARLAKLSELTDRIPRSINSLLDQYSEKEPA